MSPNDLVLNHNAMIVKVTQECGFECAFHIPQGRGRGTRGTRGGQYGNLALSLSLSLSLFPPSPKNKEQNFFSYFEGRRMEIGMKRRKEIEESEVRRIGDRLVPLSVCLKGLIHTGTK